MDFRGVDPVFTQKTGDPPTWRGRGLSKGS